METFHIFHLAACWAVSVDIRQPVIPPLSNLAVPPTISGDREPSSQSAAVIQAATSAKDGETFDPKPRIRAAAAQIIFAARNSREFIQPEDVVRIEEWCGKSILEALAGFAISLEVNQLHVRRNYILTYRID